MSAEITKRLRAASRLQSEDDFAEYAECCRLLKGGNDPDVLCEMIGALNDIQAGEIQYELIEACESFPDEIFCTIVVACSEKAYRASPYWFDLMFCSMLNTERLYDHILSRAAGNPFAVAKISELVENDAVDPEFSRKWRARQPR